VATDGSPSTDQPYVPTIVPAVEEHAVAALRQVDASFDPAAFYARVTAAFLKIQTGWATQDLQAVGAFISDGIFERFNLQFQEQREQGYRNAMDNVQVQRIILRAVHTTAQFDVAVVAITASADDYRVSLTTGSRLPAGDSDTDESFTEYWSFVRRRGTQTTAGKAGLIEGNCPNCGAAIELNQFGTCRHCRAVLRSGIYDWVLVEITQASEFALQPPSAVPGQSELEARDPDFTTAHLEDRASVMFWRRMAADRSGKIDLLRKMADPAYLAALESTLSAHPPRTYYGDCAVGSVDTRRLILDAQTERAVIEIHWSGKHYQVDAAGHTSAGNEIPGARWLFVLMRKAGARPKLDWALASAHCPACGAPETDLTASACPFCNNVVNDGSFDWVLVESMPATMPQAHALLQGTQAPL
jgi:predicted lipid-binding transport protein (Tim44 family)